jgi:hypothetical protein
MIMKRKILDKPDDREGADPAHATVETILRRVILLVLVVLFIICAIILKGFATQIDNIEQNQLDGKARAFKQRALTCTVLGAQVNADELPKTCLEPDVLAFYNPHDFPRTRSEDVADRNAVITCKLLVREAIPEGNEEPCKTILADFNPGR